MKEKRTAQFPHRVASTRKISVFAPARRSLSEGGFLTFNIEWRTTYFDRTGVANFEVRFYENQTSFDVVYGAATDNGASEASGVQLSAIGAPCDATTFSCQTPTLTNGLKVTYQLQPCGPPPPTPTASPTPTAIATPTGSPTERPTPVPRPRPTPIPRP
jgi:hypothetical protein